MKLRAILSAGALAFTAFAINPVFAQMNMDHAKMGLAAAPGMTDGEVRKIDKDAGKITIKHGPISNLQMPGMTMVFRAAAPAMLDQVKEGDKVKFHVEKMNGALTIIKIEGDK